MNWLYKRLWECFGEGLTRYYVSSQNNPTQLSELEYRFTDSNGKKYYGFTSKMGLPLSRFGRLQDFLSVLSRNIDGTTLRDLIEIAEKEIEKGVQRISENKNAGLVKIGAILYEIKERESKIKSVQLLYNVAAVQLVREDENPDVFNEKIHQEKVEQILREEDNENFFFFRLPELKKLFDSLTMSKEEWRAYLRESTKELNILQEKKKILGSKT